MTRRTTRAGTFALNKTEAVHRWYSYIEGYSSCFIEDILDSLEGEKIHTVYDPFGGCGTTSLVATQRDILPCYSETNPFMQQVVDTKINVVRRISEAPWKLDRIRQLYASVAEASHCVVSPADTWGGFEKYFGSEQLKRILGIKKQIEKISDADCRSVGMLALSSVLVAASKMVRRGDLRFAKGQEKKEKDLDVTGNFLEKLQVMITDIEKVSGRFKYDARLITQDARDLNEENCFDCVITSPPYLNGTNYIRNTKLELKLNGFIENEGDLPAFHEKGIMAGINNVSRRSREITVLSSVRPYLERLEPVAYDKRIVTMVAGYFSDMDQVISRLSRAVRGNGMFIMDIGDSQFAGVHIPTHEILGAICETYGFTKIGEDILRQRRSKNGMTLSQRLLMFRLKPKTLPDRDFKRQAEQFVEELPYKKEPYSGRNWGHPWHSLCSYHGKLKPAIAHMLVKYFTKEGDLVLDPLCGVGTIPFEACLQGRTGMGNDLSEMAYAVSKAKLEKPEKQEALLSLESLTRYIEENKHSSFVEDLKVKYKDFGYNGKVSDYFEDATYSEILCAREYFRNLIPSLSSADSMVLSCLLHVLHGNRPYALSRNSHPLTPYAPGGEFVYKNVAEHVRAKMELVYKKGEFDQYHKGKAIFGDYERIDGLTGKVDVIISSPPFAGSIRFYMNNWLRLWFCGWEAQDYKLADQRFLDYRQKYDFSVYESFFSMCDRVLKPNGRLILHLGRTTDYDMACELAGYASSWFDCVCAGEEDVSGLERHGLKDKGATVGHQFLFLQKK